MGDRILDCWPSMSSVHRLRPSLGQGVIFTTRATKNFMGSKILVLSEGREEEEGVQILAEDHLQTHAGEWEREKRKKETQTNIMGEGERQRCRDKARPADRASSSVGMGRGLFLI